MNNAPSASSLDRLRQENDRLRDRIAILEETLVGNVSRFPVAWALTCSEERIFGVLTTRELATRDAIMAALYFDGGASDVQVKTIDVFICKIRRKLERHGIEIHTIRGRGYSVDRSVREQFRKAASAR